MPDTGAPWNIPYVAGTDLVSDWPTDSLALANAIDSGLDNLLAGGIGSNVVSTTKTDTFTSTTAGFTAITGLSATITPSSDTSLVLVIYNVMSVSDGNQAAHAIRLMRGATPIGVGAAAGSRVQATTVRTANQPNQVNNSIGPSSGVFLDSPATASSVTYSIDIWADSTGGVYVNRGVTDTDSTSFVRGSSTLTVIEVAA